jgi:NTP pyrophosphatase (non-canonical NTP hydrolase)
MKINELFAVNIARANHWHPQGLDEWSALEWAGAMTGEAGEAANAAKKIKRLEGGLRNITQRDQDYQAASEHVAKEVADTIIYGLLLMARVGITDPESVIREVFNRKSVEYGFVERI